MRKIIAFMFVQCLLASSLSASDDPNRVMDNLRESLESEEDGRHVHRAAPREEEKKSSALSFTMVLAEHGLHPNYYLDQIISNSQINLDTFSAQLKSMVDEIIKLKPGENVHALDGILYAKPENIKLSVEIATLLELGDTSWTLDKAEQQLKDFLTQHPQITVEYSDGVAPKTRLSHDNILGHVHQAFETLKKNYASHLSVMEVLCSQALSFAINRFDIFESDDALVQFLTATSENYLTGGGCPQGVVNRLAKCHITFTNGLIQDALKYQVAYLHWRELSEE